MEIKQQQPAAATSLKAFCMDGQYDVICFGNACKTRLWTLFFSQSEINNRDGVRTLLQSVINFQKKGGVMRKIMTIKFGGLRNN